MSCQRKGSKRKAGWRWRSVFSPWAVGEVVEYWEGAFVRGERLGSGEPAFVKRVEGKGQYAIKMVGASRGKFRMCGWKSLFKDGSFNKNVARRDGATALISLFKDGR